MIKLRLGIIGAGLMGREVASAISRWCALSNVPVELHLTAVCDVNPTATEWFQSFSGITTITQDADALLASPDVDAVYVALPHHLHAEVYEKVLRRGKALLAEKPFGIDLAAARHIENLTKETGQFVRVSSEFPFFPGAQRAFQYVAQGKLGRPLSIRSAFHHSSDLDPTKPANWKRRSETCGEIGVMGDLGLHVAHLPLRLGIQVESVYSQLQKGFATRSDGKGGFTECDTWDDATLHMWAERSGSRFPMTWEMKRLAPGETNTWIFEALGTEGGVRFSTKNPKRLEIFNMGPEQSWSQIDLGHHSVFPVVTGGIFEFGFPDSFLQMLAAFAFEWAGKLEDRFGCATPQEALMSHRIFDAALRSHQDQTVVRLDP